MLLSRKLPDIQGWATVYIMEMVRDGVKAEIIKVWQELTGGGLTIVLDGDKPMGSIRGYKLPAAVRRALSEGSTVDALEMRRGFWWVTAPSQTPPTPVQLVAWSEEGQSWGHLLQVWTDMLVLALGEKEVVDKLTEALVRAWDRLTFLYEITHIAGQLSGIPEMLASIVDLLAQVVSVEEVFVVTNGENGWDSVTASGRELSGLGELVTLIHGSGRPIGLEELRPALERDGSQLTQCGDLLVAPLPSGDEPMGAIGFMDTNQSRFDASDVQLLASVAEQVYALIEARLARSTREERRRLEHELSVAADIQASLLPIRLPEIEKLDIAAYLQPARRVGGDFYDVAESKSGEPMLLLADVAGKGTPAAILTALVHATFNGEVSHRRDPANLLQIMGRLIYQDLDKAETFVTAFVVRLEEKPLGFEYASAGHVDAALWRKKEQLVEFLPATGIPLGIELNANYESKKVLLHPGDLLLIYSDGVTEAENPTGKILGLQGLADIIYATNPAGSEDQIRVIVQGLDVHRSGLPLRDDVALLLIRTEDVDEEQPVVVPFVFPGDVTAVGRVVELVRGLSPKLPLTNSEHLRQVTDDFALALSEVVTNQVRHAYQNLGGRIQGRVEVEEDKLVANLYDTGIPFRAPASLLATINLENPPERGYGLKLVRGLLDGCEYRRLESERNHWHLVMNLTGGASNEN